MFLPGVVPWWDYSSPNTTWGLGAIFGFLLGVSVGRHLSARHAPLGEEKPETPHTTTPPVGSDGDA
jgi:hypothetical protein